MLELPYRPWRTSFDARDIDEVVPAVTASVRTTAWVRLARLTLPRARRPASWARRLLRPSVAGLAVAALALAAARLGVGAELSSPHPTPAEGPRETFTVVYSVTISADDPTLAHVRWDLTGIDEVLRIRLKVDAGRFDGFRGSGTIEQRRGEVVWWPEAPYAHLEYAATLQHRRAPEKGFDSWATSDCVVARTQDLFPQSAVFLRPEIEASPESRSRLVFHLPDGWDAVTAMPADGHLRFVVEDPKRRFDHPYGWFLLGHFKRTQATIDGTTVTIAAAPGGSLPPEELIGFLQRTLPSLTALLAVAPERLLIVSAPDPMWRGGLSGEASLFMHAGRPLRTPDRTSPYLHELFHVLAPFRAAPDAVWAAEGLAEFYSVEIQRRIGALDADGYRRALRSFARHGLWGHDFTRTRDFALRNNSAPLVMYALDQRIRRATKGKHGLDEVVTALARERGILTTARFLGTVRRVAGVGMDVFFRRHVYGGELPPLPGLDLRARPRRSP
jgi:hypothetical protein